MNRFDILDPKTPILGHHFLEASAGTGKTFAIEHITARLVLEHDFSIDEILVVTFTRAATRELKTRIRTTLKSKPSCLNLERALARIDQAPIYTIHGFCHRMLTEYAYEAGLMGLVSEEPTEYRTILEKQIDDFFRTSLTYDAFSTPQIASLLPRGKEKILSLIEKEGEFPCYPSFSEAYHDYLAVRKKLFFPSDLIGHFNKIKDKTGCIKEPYQTQLALLEKSEISLKEFEALTAQPNILSLLTPANFSKKSTLDPTLLYDFCAAVTPFIEPMTSPRCTLMRIARTLRTIAHKTLLEKKILTPNEILKKMRDALRNPEFCSKVRSRFRAAIIDEFQDTDPIQWEIFKTLFIDEPAPVLYLVGDPKQSIYSFRSADIYTYLAAAKEVSKKAQLDTNYRSDPKLIQALNHLFSQNPEWLSLPDASLPFQPVKHPSTASDRIFPDDKEPIHFFIYETEKKSHKSWPSAEIERTTFFPFIANEILSLNKQGIPFADFAILVKDRYQAARLKSYLDTYSIPTNAKSTEPLSTTPTFALVRTLLEALIDPTEIPVKRFLANFHSSQELIDINLLTKTIAAFARPQTLQEALRTLYMPTTLDTYSDYTYLSELLLARQTQTKATLPELLTYLLSLTDISRRPLSDTNSVTIMTIHMSKGLEFNIVFALGLINRYTSREEFVRHGTNWLLNNPEHPSCQSALQKQEAEKLRQLYVALTRAKHRLYIPILRDTSNSPIPPGQASPLELFNPTPTSNVTYLQPQDLPSTPPDQPTLYPPTEPIPTYTPRYLHSYSSLAQTTPQLPLDITTDLPKGPETGILLHSLLEHLLKKKPLPPIPAQFPAKAVHTLLKHALNTPLTPLPIRLSQIPTSDLHTEVEFFYPDGDNYVKGYIDLIFRYQDAYYLLDWKTNLLASYDPESLHEAMAHHDYYLQASLYHTALSRYLASTNTPVAGTFYIFLRGLPDSGIFFLPNEKSPVLCC